MSSGAEPLQGIRNPLLRVLVYSHVWLALGAAAQTWWMQAMLSASVTSSGAEKWRAPALAFCGTILFYTFMRLARMDHPELGTSPHLVWFRRNKHVLTALASLSALMGCIIGWPYVRQLMVLLWPVGLVASLYVIPQWIAGGRTFGLRRIPVLKAFLIAFVWAAMTVGTPVALDGGRMIWDGAPWIFGMQFSFFLSLAIVFDIRDMQRDQRSLRTIPQSIGIAGTRFMAVLLQLPWILFLTVMLLLSYGPIGERWREPVVDFGFLLPMLGYLFTAWLLVMASAKHTDTYFAFALDGTLILIPLLAWAGGLL